MLIRKSIQNGSCLSVNGVVILEGVWLVPGKRNGVRYQSIARSGYSIICERSWAEMGKWALMYWLDIACEN